jgi:hypothetical protein
VSFLYLLLRIFIEVRGYCHFHRWLEYWGCCSALLLRLWFCLQDTDCVSYACLSIYIPTLKTILNTHIFWPMSYWLPSVLLFIFSRLRWCLEGIRSLNGGREFQPRLYAMSYYWILPDYYSTEAHYLRFETPFDPILAIVSWNSSKICLNYLQK